MHDYYYDYDECKENVYRPIFNSIVSLAYVENWPNFRAVWWKCLLIVLDLSQRVNCELEIFVPYYPAYKRMCL